MYLDLLLFAFQKTDWAGDDDACSSYGHAEGHQLIHSRLVLVRTNHEKLLIFEIQEALEEGLDWQWLGLSLDKLFTTSKGLKDRKDLLNNLKVAKRTFLELVDRFAG
ncbi:hypothetical protein PENARI_c085G01484, partial [Penicillium arizonense]